MQQKKKKYVFGLFWHLRWCEVLHSFKCKALSVNCNTVFVSLLSHEILRIISFVQLNNFFF